MLWIYLCLLPIAYGFGIDYDIDSPLRARDRPCSKRKRTACMNWCDTEYSLCYGNKCYCIPVYYYRRAKRDSVESDKGPAAGKINIKGVKKALRHHIAHFCPNLDTARQCIFKCMKTGKPAFCGRDHVCYCGHRYTPTDDDDQYNTKEAYGQFKDLYQKYFGPNYANDYDVV